MKKMKKMKKAVAWILASAVLLGTAGCAAKSKAPAGDDVKDSTELLSQVWDSYKSSERFPAAGGDYNNSVMDEPGAVDVTDTEFLDAIMHIPQEAAEQLEEGTVLMHMMNANTFTSGAFCLKEGADRKEVAAAIEKSVMETQWLCGFPDQLLIAGVGERYLVMAFGKEEPMSVFQEKLKAAFAGTEVFYEETITE